MENLGVSVGGVAFTSREPRVCPERGSCLGRRTERTRYQPGGLIMAARLTHSRENIQNVGVKGLWHSMLSDPWFPCA